MRYRTIVADPPWPLADLCMRPVCGAGGKRKRATVFPYKTMPLADIMALDVAALAEEESHLYLWVPAKLNREGKGVATAEAWGFDVVSEIVWQKPGFGLGAFPRPQHEMVLVCRKGKLPFSPRNVGSVQRWAQVYDGARGKKHSAKPDGFMDLVERASPGPYLELFSRRARLGWDTWGDEALHGFAHLATESQEAAPTKEDQ